jgi:peptidase A4-like protein
MHRRMLVVAAAAVTFLVMAMPGGSAQPRTDVPQRHRLLPVDVHVPLAQHNADQDSLNWSGYAAIPATGHRVTGVSGSWTVPSAGIVPPGFSSTWAGIGGYNTGDLIQAGTTQDTLDGYYAWYEMLPDTETPIDGCNGDAACTVNPGDNVSTDIHSLGGDQWSISLANAGKWTWSTTVSYASTFSSAEWIVEAPTFVVAQTTIAQLGTVHLDQNRFALDGGSSSTIAQGGPVSIRLSLAGLLTEATPSALDAQGDGFNVCTYTSSCPTPS